VKAGWFNSSGLPGRFKWRCARLEQSLELLAKLGCVLVTVNSHGVLDGNFKQFFIATEQFISLGNSRQSMYLRVMTISFGGKTGTPKTNHTGGVSDSNFRQI
jgi:hypothetical protein